MISEKLSTDSRRMLQNGVPQFVGFCRCTPCRQRRGKDLLFKEKALWLRMHPVQAAPRQRIPPWRRRKMPIDAPRAGSAEAKPSASATGGSARMHPVQAAPRQRYIYLGTIHNLKDAPRAGSAEAKRKASPRRMRSRWMHPVQAAPRQSVPGAHAAPGMPGCTPCRQRRGKVGQSGGQSQSPGMHPVQAAPRQRGAASRRLYTTSTMHPVQAAPRQSPQGEALQGKEPGCTPCRQRRGKGQSCPSARSRRWMHPVQAAPRQSDLQELL